MATLIWVSFDPESGEIEYVTAGHPPAFVRGPQGDVEELNGERSPPVGIMGSPRFVANRARLEPGSVLFMYTDGLVERRATGIDPGLARLREALAEAPAEAEACADAAIEALDPAEAADDVAILAIHFDPDDNGSA